MRPGRTRRPFTALWLSGFCLYALHAGNRRLRYRPGRRPSTVITVNEDFAPEVDEEPPGSSTDEAAIDAVRDFFEHDPERVFFSRQVETHFEKTWFHWITNRAVKALIADGEVRDERRPLGTGGMIHLMWHRSYRYHRRAAAAVVDLVEQYADPDIGHALGHHGEAMTLEGFASLQFVMRGRETRSFGDKVWTETAHDLDFIFERNGIAYGVEVKNTLGYMDQDELRTKMRLCHHIGVRPVFVTRMLPRNWILDIRDEGGFALILGWQLYPWTHRKLAARVRRELELPVDTPRRLESGTMQRFLNWHERQIV